jgi:hypothetical protein
MIMQGVQFHSIRLAHSFMAQYKISHAGQDSLDLGVVSG